MTEDSFLAKMSGGGSPNLIPSTSYNGCLSFSHLYNV